MLSLIDSKTPHTLELSSLLPWLFHPRFFYDSFSLSWLLNVGMRQFPVLGPFIFRWWSHNSLMTWNTIYILINSKYMTASKHHSSTLNSCNSQLPTQCLHLVCNIDLDWCDYMWILFSSSTTSLLQPSSFFTYSNWKQRGLAWLFSLSLLACRPSVALYLEVIPVILTLGATLLIWATIIEPPNLLQQTPNWSPGFLPYSLQLILNISQRDLSKT